MAHRIAARSTGLRRLACAAISSFVVLSAPTWVRAEPTEAQIIEALRMKPNDGLGAARSLARPKAGEHRRAVDEVRGLPARSLTTRQRAKLSDLARERPSIDIEVNFEYDSAAVGPKALRPLLALGRALASEQLKGSIFVINGHTDAKGSVEYNQGLSERRAEAVKRVLIEELKLPADSLIAVGHGKSQLKNEADPFAGENRRVQIVNTGYSAVSSSSSR
jgi:outer membrane protein OmpA-like peptidoglycan-associated protein